MAGQNQAPNMDLFDAYFRRADLDQDGRISGAEAVAFFQGSNLSKQALAQIWMHADQKGTGFLGRAEFYNALKLVTVAQSKRELTPDIVKTALYSPAAAKIPAPQINLPATATPQLNSMTAAHAPRMAGVVPAASQNVGFRGPQVLPNSSTNQQYFPSPGIQFMRPPQAIPAGAASLQTQSHLGQGFPGGGGVVGPRLPTSSISTDWFSGRTGGAQIGASVQVPNKGISSSMNQDAFSLSDTGITPSIPPRTQAKSALTYSNAPQSQIPISSSSKPAIDDSKASAVPVNGFASDSVFGGEVFSATIAQSKQDSSTHAFFSNIVPASSAVVPVSTGPQPSVKPNPLDYLQNSFSLQPVGSQLQNAHSFGKQNQQVSAPSTAVTSPGISVTVGDSVSTQSQLTWPRMTQSDVKKYTKVFVEVDTDRDGKITGEQARNLFLSWRLPREVLKQVWDLSDQDNDSMLSLREFCTALYLMERYREGRPLPAVLPSSIIFVDTLFPTIGQPTAAYGNATWGPTPGLRQQQGIPGAQQISLVAGVRPSMQAPAPQADGGMQPNQQKSRMPVLEKHLVNQLSKDEQNTLNSKFHEATEADKKVEELEKEILDSKEKIEFYRTKMQELVLYKSRCDNRLNEITERASADKREVESLAKKYEEKYKQVGEIASKLTIEEATFRDIQERKMELYQAIVKMEQGGSADGILQVRADRIQSDLEELVKALNERCKKYGLRVKPTALVELPFGWQPGIQESAADWDEDWDTFEDEGYNFVKELTLDVKNVMAPPKPKSTSLWKEKNSLEENITTASSQNVEAKSDQPSSMGGRFHEGGSTFAQSEDGSTRSPPGSPAGSSALESPSQEFTDSHFGKVFADASPSAKEIHSHRGGMESMFFGDKSFDEPSWGTFDTDDTDSVWRFNDASPKGTDHKMHKDSLFGSGNLGLAPIRTDSLHADSIFRKKSPFTFGDSVPGSPLFNSGNSPQRFSEGSEGPSFDNFSRNDSFSVHESGFFPPPKTLTRFDTSRSNRDSDHSRGFPSFDDKDPFGSTGPFKSSLESRNSKRDPLTTGVHFS